MHTSSFITSTTNFNGFEGIGQNFGYPANTPYTEDGLSVEYVGTANIWTDSQVGEGLYSWYENGGGTGFTKITLASLADFDALQFLGGSGWFNGGGLNIQYDILNNGASVATGSVGPVSGYTGFSYFGFSGGGFDEVRLQVQAPGYTGGFNPGAFEAGAYDSFAAGSGGVPEPATWALMIGGFGMAGGMIRRRKTVTA